MKGLIIECLRCLEIFPVSREVSIISLKSGVSVVDSFEVCVSYKMYVMYVCWSMCKLSDVCNVCMLKYV